MQDGLYQIVYEQWLWVDDDKPKQNFVFYDSETKVWVKFNRHISPLYLFRKDFSLIEEQKISTLESYLEGKTQPQSSEEAKRSKEFTSFEATLLDEEKYSDLRQKINEFYNNNLALSKSEKALKERCLELGIISLIR